MIQDEFAGNWTQMCSYLAPSQRSLCSGLKSSTIPTGKITVDGAVISGNLALVKVTGKACFGGNGCQRNSNPSLGLPTGSETFKQAYDKQLRDNGFSPVPCIKVNGKWYVNATAQ